MRWPSGRLEEMGALMDASHQSLRDDFDASTARLDAMVTCAREAGALGARLTGAGFGGCIIALAREADAAAVLDRLEKRLLREARRRGGGARTSYHRPCRTGRRA